MVFFLLLLLLWFSLGAVYQEETLHILNQFKLYEEHIKCIQTNIEAKNLYDYITFLDAKYNTHKI